MSCYNTIPRSLRLRLQESLIDAISNTLLEEFNNLKIVDNIFNIYLMTYLIKLKIYYI